MKQLPLSFACWDYDRVGALSSGLVRPDGIELNHLVLPVEETFYRMAKFQEFDVAEMSLSSYTVTLARDNPPLIAIPVFPSRSFRHNGIYIHTRSGIREPRDLIGKRVGVPEYQLTAPVWIRGILSDDHGVAASSVEHFTGGIETPGREEKIKVQLPPEFRVTAIGPHQTLAQMLADGELDAMYSPRMPSTLRTRPQDVQRLFGNHVEVERDYFRRTGIFPPMHTIVIRREVYEKNRWIAQSLYKAFVQAQRKTYEDLAEVAALKVMLPWLAAHVEDTRQELGDDWWRYGLEPNRHALDTFLRYHHEQGLSPRRLAAQDLFAPETLGSSFVI